MHFVWRFAYRDDFQPVAVGAKKAQRRQEEGTKNSCGIRNKKADFPKKDSRKDVDAYPLRRAAKRKGCL